MRKITKEELYADVEKFLKEHNSTRAEDYYKYGSFKQRVVLNYGGWVKTLEHFGLTKTDPSNKVSFEDLLEDIQRVINETGSTLNLVYREHGKYSSCVIRRFGSWNKILQTLGYKLNMWKPGQYSKEDMINKYLELEQEFGKGKVTSVIYRKYSGYSQLIVDKTFGNFTNFQRLMGGKVDGRYITDEEIEEDIKNLEKLYGVLSTPLYNEEGLISNVTLIKRFGSLKSLCKKLGVKYTGKGRNSKLFQQCMTIVKTFLGNKFVCEKTFPWLRNPKTDRPLFLDAYYEDLKLGIEVDGGQHFHCYQNYCPTKKDLKVIQERDSIKEKLCKENGITIVHIKKPSYPGIRKILKKYLDID